MSESPTNSAETLTAEVLVLLNEYSRITAWLELPKDAEGESLRTQLQARRRELAVSLVDILKRARGAGLRLTLGLPWAEPQPETVVQETVPKDEVPPSPEVPHLPDIVERLAACVDQEQEFSEVSKIFREFAVPPTEDKPTLWTLLAYIVARLRRRTKRRGSVWPLVFGEVDDFCRHHGLERVHGTFNVDCAKTSWDQDATVHLARLREIIVRTP